MQDELGRGRIVAFSRKNGNGQSPCSVPAGSLGEAAGWPQAATLNRVTRKSFAELMENLHRPGRSVRMR